VKLLTSIFKWVVFSNIWISLGVGATTYVGMKKGIVPFDIQYCLIAGLATLFAYNIQRIFKLEDGILIPSERHIWIEKNRNIILVLSIFGGTAGLLFSIYTLTFNSVICSVPFLLLVLLYAYSIGKLKALRELPFAKITIISAVWTWTIAVLPVVNKGIHLDIVNWWYILFIFLFVFALCIPFDIRDIDNDKSKIKTLPIVIGKKNAIFVSLTILAACLYIAFYFNWLELEALVVISSLLVILSNKKRSELFYTGLLDGMFLLLYVIYRLYAVIL
jgi:4-hydroxybenzoate polyprenyltransferase